MKNIISIISLIFAIILISGCKKETYENKRFIIGVDNDFVDITILDSTIKIIAPGHNHTSENFDVDNDGVIDFEIHSEHGMSPGGYNYQESSIKIVNSSFQISVIEMSDTLQRCMHMQVEYDTVIYYIYYNNYSAYTCYGDGIDTTFSPNIFYYPSIHMPGESLTQLETWSGDDLTLSSYDGSNYIWFPHYKLYSVLRGNWNNQNMKYILFKKEYNSIALYGWLRLSIDNYKEIRVYEYAIQKEINI